VLLLFATSTSMWLMGRQQAMDGSTQVVSSMLAFLVMIVLWFLFAAGFQWASSPGQGPLSPACSLFVAAKDFGAGILPAAGAATAPGAAPTAGQAASCAQTGSFNPWLYSLDTLLPIDLSYQPSFKPVDSGWGNVVRWMIVLETTFGWLGIGLLIAAFTSLIKKD